MQTQRGWSYAAGGMTATIQSVGILYGGKGSASQRRRFSLRSARFKNGFPKLLP